MSYFIRYAEIRDLDEDIVNLEVIFKSNSIIYHSFHQILYFFLSVFLLMTYHLSPKLVPYWIISVIHFFDHFDLCTVLMTLIKLLVFWQGEWDGILQRIDQSLKEDDTGVELGDTGPVNVTLTDARTGQETSLMEYLGHQSLVLVLLRHFAWLPWRQHIEQVEKSEVWCKTYGCSIISKSHNLT